MSFAVFFNNSMNNFAVFFNISMDKKSESFYEQLFTLHVIDSLDV